MIGSIATRRFVSMVVDFSTERKRRRVGVSNHNRASLFFR
jgi:hypothetical protein